LKDEGREYERQREITTVIPHQFRGNDERGMGRGPLP
jgi:hypothetical protein